MKAIRTILACLRKADATYNLMQHKDKIVVGLSGGKDSVALLYALSLYQKFSHTNYIIQPVILDLGFEGFNPSIMIDFCKSLDLNLIVYDARDVYKILLANKEDDKHLPCSICSKMKKAAINKVANELGFNKVAFAHHADDAIETLFMNEIYGGRVATFAPKMHLERANITFIRPFSLVREKDIVSLIKEENLPVLTSACPSDKFTTREDIKNVINNIYKQFKESKNNFLTMLSNYEKYSLWDDDITYQLNAEGLTLKPVIRKEDQINVNNIRYQVFVKDMGIDYSLEFEYEKEITSTSFLILLENKPIGTIRYRKTELGYKIERFAILKEYQKKGYGRLAITFLKDLLISKFNPCTIYIHGMSHLKDFYLSLGFNIEGEPFYEADIEHFLFKKVS